MRYRELSASAEDRSLLARFYGELYLPEFPHPDERESLENMARYLELKAAGWYGPNGYHILLAFEGDALVGGSVSDYLSEASAGVVEFLVVVPGRRGRGDGTVLLERTEAALVSDATRRGAGGLDWVLAEIEDPFKVHPRPGAIDAFGRAAVWHRWGYRRLDFPYVQPALSVQQRPATHLMLLVKTPDRRGEPLAAVSSDRLKQVLREYLRWAMRIPDPEASAEYVAMARYLDATREIRTRSLLAYIGRRAGGSRVVSPARRAPLRRRRRPPGWQAR